MNHQEIKKSLEKEFEEKYGSLEGAELFFAPGRVNLIGEHTDYNGGRVFPCAITFGTYALARKRSDDLIRCDSLNMDPGKVFEKRIGEIVEFEEEDSWTNYANGMVKAMLDNGYGVAHGYDAVICGNIPVGSGLSSSASLLVLIGCILREYNSIDVTNERIAWLGQYTENHYIGVQSGIMDEFAIAMGKKDHAIYLDTATLKFEYAPIDLTGYKLMIMNTNKKRGLHDSKYNERVRECTQALHDLQKVMKITALGELSSAEFEKAADNIQDPVNRKRAKHAVYENERTKLAVEALNAHDLAEFGRLMNESHISLRDDYEVTGIELDTLAETAWTLDGVVGARMTGAGFGGCAIAIVKDEAVEAFTKKITAVYTEKIGYAPSVYAAEIGDGPGRIA